MEKPIKKTSIHTYRNAFYVVSFLVIAFLQLSILEASNNIHAESKSFHHFFYFTQTVNPMYLLSSFSLILLCDCLFSLLFRPKIGVLIADILCTAISLTNYFVLIWHGTPFTFNLIKNAMTAVNVLSGYRITMTPCLWNLVLLILGTVILTVVLFSRCTWKRIYFIPSIVPLLIFVTFSYFSPKSIVPKNIVSWSWANSLSKYGYTNCFVQHAVSCIHVVKKPSAYKEKRLQVYTENYETIHQGGKTPDIILILNETWFDLQKITNVQADSDIFFELRHLDNSLHGYTVVPHVGGGTNCTEYELLTSNSLQVSDMQAPFCELNLMGASSAATYLKQQGYETLAAHCEPGTNYNRHYSYPAIGFDTAYFKPDFEGLEGFGGRSYYSTDASVYRNMIKWYENMSDAPRFVYLMTFQNHGGWEFLRPEEITVHIGENYGDQSHSVEEFETCVRKSNEAFIHLTEYFKRCDRDVIICMLGDHGPNFEIDIADKNKKTEKQMAIDLRSTPYVIWSNYMELKNKDIPKLFSVPYVVPTVFDLAQISCPGYYDYMLSMRDQVPMLGSFGLYATADGTIREYGGSDENQDIINRYMCMDYANISKKSFMMDFMNP